MEHYSQRDPRWKNEKMGTSNYTIGSQGCFISSLGMLAYKTPHEVNDIMTKKGGYANGCLVKSIKASQILGLRFDYTQANPLGKTKTKPNFICIAETHDYDRPSTSYKEQHFFVFAPKGTVSEVADLILDPLNTHTVWEQNKYRIVSYRMFHENVPIPDTEMEHALEWNASYKPKPMVGTVTGQTKTDREIILMLYRFNKGL